jgi:SAM-dependent methyltransferase
MSAKRVVSMYDALGRYFDLIYPHDEFARAFSGAVRAIHKRLGKNNGLRIVDLCCGTGRTLSAFAGARVGTFCGIDINEEMLKKARTHFPQASFVNEDVLSLRRSDLPVQDCDLVIMGGSSMQHFSPAQRKRVMKLAHDLLRPGGLFVFDVQRRQHTNAVVRRVFVASGRLVVILLFRELGPKYIQQYSFVIEWPANSSGEADVRFDKFELFSLSSTEARTEGIRYGLHDRGSLRTSYKPTEFICFEKPVE